MSRNRIFVTILLVTSSVALSVFGVSCGIQAKESKDCATKPSAIFSDTMAIVLHHAFEYEGQESLEEVELKNEVRVSVFQSGCKAIRQEFRISRKGDFLDMPDPAWVVNAYQTLGGLSIASPALGGLETYARSIAQGKESIRLGQAFQPEPGLHITVDKIASRDEGTLIVVLQGAE